MTLVVVAASGSPVNQPPVAIAAATPTSGPSPLTVAFSAAGSADADGTIAAYGWAFGNGATLTVTDNVGAHQRDGGGQLTAAPAAPSAPASATASVSGRTVTIRWTDTSATESGFYIEQAVKGLSRTGVRRHRPVRLLERGGGARALKELQAKRALTEVLHSR